MGVNSLPKTVTRQRRGCDLNTGPSAPESSTLTARLPIPEITSPNYRFSLDGDYHLNTGDDRCLCGLRHDRCQLDHTDS